MANYYLKHIAFAVMISLSLMAGQANAWTITTRGTIDYGFDDHGFFAAAGGLLSGLEYTNTVTLDPNKYDFQQNDGVTHSSSHTLYGTATDTLTINGVTQVFTWDLSQNNYGESLLSHSLNPAVGDEVRQFELGNDASGRYFASFTQLSSTFNNTHLNLDYNQVWSYNVKHTDNAYFEFYSDDKESSGGVHDLYLNSTPTFVSINAEGITKVSTVPEPEVYAMLLAGLGLISFNAKRKKIIG